MDDTRTAEEVRAQCVAAMPAPLGKLYDDLRNQLAWIHLKWNDFRALYADSLDTIDLLNEAAPDFFHNLQRLMWEDVLLHLCRITDRSRIAGKETLTVRRLEAAITETSLHQTVSSLAKDANQKAKFARDWRNRRLAHRELPTVTGQSSKPLAHASRQNVEEALSALRATMNAVSQHYLDSTTAYGHSIETLGGVAALLSRVRLGVEARRAKLERLRNP